MSDERVLRDIVADRQLISCAPDASVRAACKQMAEHRVSAMLVMENKKLIGIFTERDALVRVLVEGRNPDKTPIADVMVRDPQTVRAALPLAYALLLMVEGGFRHAPVVDDAGQVIGMVSARDALGQDMVRLERELSRRETLENPRS